MAPPICHLIVGERVFAQLPQLNPTNYAGFLLGCVLVDVHAFSDIDRRATHFADRLVRDGPNALDRSCANFLSQLDSLLVCPWNELTSAEQAFIAGYLCHLAADEDWKEFDWNTLHTTGMYLWTDLPVPGRVIVTTFDVLSSELYTDFSALISALSNVSVPDVLTHVPHWVFQTMWDVVKPHIMDGSIFELHIEMTRGPGKTSAGTQSVCHQHDIYWEDAVESVQRYFGGVQPRIQAMVQRSLETMPLLYQ
jgi:hypothetical protein